MWECVIVPLIKIKYFYELDKVFHFNRINVFS